MLNDIVLPDGLPFAEAAQSQRGDVQGMGTPVEDFFCQEESAGRTMHKTVAGETIDEIKALYFVYFAEDGVRIRTDLIESCPPAGDARVFEKRHPGHGCLEMDEFPLAVHLLVETGGLFKLDIPVRMAGPSRWK